jgi:Cu+-exporting ATPase
VGTGRTLVTDHEAGHRGRRRHHVLLTAVAAVAGLRWFFARRRAGVADLTDGVQPVDVTVRGGYRPDLVPGPPGVPVALVFDRQESGDCTSRVVFGDLAVGLLVGREQLGAS